MICMNVRKKNKIYFLKIWPDPGKRYSAVYQNTIVDQNCVSCASGRNNLIDHRDLTLPHFPMFPDPLLR